MHAMQKLPFFGRANFDYCWYRFISLIILERDRFSSEFRLGLRLSLCNMFVNYILCQLFLRMKYRNSAIDGICATGAKLLNKW